MECESVAQDELSHPDKTELQKADATGVKANNSGASQDSDGVNLSTEAVSQDTLQGDETLQSEEQSCTAAVCPSVSGLSSQREDTDGVAPAQVQPVGLSEASEFQTGKS